MWKRTRVEANPVNAPTGSNDCSPPNSLQQLLHNLVPENDDYASALTKRILELAAELNASDIHLDAQPEGHLLRLRIDGTLREIGCLPRGQRTELVGRIKSLAQLLTYRNDIPQEGRLTFGVARREARVVTFPTLHGERVVIRLVTAQDHPWQLQDLGLSDRQLMSHERALSAPSGVVIVSGAVGTGKTTSAYAALRWLAAPQPHQLRLRRCVVTLEDPIESELPGVAQAQIDAAAGFDWMTGLRSLLRQDPEVIFIGEIRDAQTAQLAFRASMTGQLVITTMHARSSCEALLRLLDMQVPSQHLLSGLQLLTCQRLVPRRCQCQDGCQQCDFTGFRGRQLQAEILPELEAELARIAINGCDLRQLQQAALANGWEPFEV